MSFDCKLSLLVRHVAVSSILLGWIAVLPVAASAECGVARVSSATFVQTEKTLVPRLAIEVEYTAQNKALASLVDVDVHIACDSVFGAGPISEYLQLFHSDASGASMLAPGQHRQFVISAPYASLPRSCKATIASCGLNLRQ